MVSSIIPDPVAKLRLELEEEKRRRTSVEAELARTQRIAHVGSWVWQVKTNQLEWSDQMYQIFGIEKAAFTGNLIDVVAKSIHPDDRAAVEASNQLVIHQGKPTPLEYRIIRPDGSIRTVWAEAAELTLDESGQPDRLSGIVLDITDRISSTEAFRRSAETHRALISSLPDIVMRFDREGRHLFVSDRVTEVTDLTPAQFIGKTHRELGFPAHLCQMWEEAILLVFDSGVLFENEFAFDGKKGRTIFNWRLNPERDANGKVQSVLSLSRDVTAQRKAEEDYKMLFQEMLDGFALHEIICDESGKPVDYRFLAVNPSFERMTGLKADEVVGKTVLQAIPGAEGHWIDTYGHVAQTGEPIHFENYSVNLDKHFEVTAFRPAPGKFACIFTDVTTRKQAEVGLHAAHARLDALWSISSLSNSDVKTISDHVLKSITRMTNSPYGFYGFISEDEATMTIHSWSGEAMKDCSMVVKPQQFPISEAGVWGEAVRRREPLILNYYSNPHPAKKGLPEGHVPLTKLLVIPYFNNGKITAVAAVANRATDYASEDVAQINTFLLSIQALTASKRAEHALRESEERFRTVANFTYDWEYWLGPDRRFIYCSPACERITGYTVEDFQKNPDLLVSIVHPEDRNRVDHHFTDPTGQVIEVHQGEYRIITRTGEIRWIGHACQMVRDSEGEYRGRRASNRDITEQKTLQQQLLQSQKLESIGNLAGGVAHDFNNMLGVIIGRTESALEKVTPGDPLQRDLEEIMHSARHSADLTRQLLAFARKQTAVPVVIELNQIIDVSLKMLRRLIGENIRLSWEPASQIWNLKIDPAQIDQILANLAVNARDAISGQGTISLRTQNQTLKTAPSALTGSFVPGDYVRLTVSDSGCGMDAATVGRIFEPFFTTKEAGKGTGLGLATVYGIVLQNGGQIQVHSEPSKGTTFHLFFPRCQETVSAPLEKSTASLPEIFSQPGNTTILLVEDEPSLLEISKIGLERFGFSVLPAASPEEALTIATSHPGPIHLLVSDIIMPEMNGRELQEKIQGLRPAILSLFISGYNADIIARQGLISDKVNFLQKPFTGKKLGEKILQILQKETGPHPT